VLALASRARLGARCPHRLAERLGPDAVIVTPAVDTAFKYMSVSPLTDLC
jgi:hypothetical protein